MKIAVDFTFEKKSLKNLICLHIYLFVCLLVLLMQIHHSALRGFGAWCAVAKVFLWLLGHCCNVLDKCEGLLSG